MRNGCVRRSLCFIYSLHVFHIFPWHFLANPVVHSVVCLRRLQLPCHPPETHREPSLCMLCIVFWSTSSWG